MDADVYALAARVEDEHWWFRGRRAILRVVLDRYASGAPGSRRVLEVGCGNGGNLSLLSAYGRVFATEIDDSARARAAGRAVGRVERGWLPDGLPFDGERFDLVAALDVLEHVEDDRDAVRALRARLTDDGLLVLTVPAHGSLWSRHDERSHHRRRYTRGGLVSLVAAADCTVVYSSYFNALLFPLAVAYVTLSRLGLAGPDRAMQLPPVPLNRLLGAIFSLESLLIPRVSLPFGVSILVCARAK